MLKSLKNGKATGEDLVINEFLKLTANKLLKFYTNLFNAVLESGEIPEAWTSGLIIPIYKKGDPKNLKIQRIIEALLSSQY